MLRNDYLTTSKIKLVYLFAKNNILKIEPPNKLNYLLLFNKITFGIGSILSWYTVKNCIVWGSGIMNKNAKIFPANFLAVRGKHTQQRISEIGYTPPKVIGDPALLLPIIYTPQKSNRKNIGIIPHFKHYNEVSAKFKNDQNIVIINLLDDIEKIINQINSCYITLSTSLHGIIVSHAYSVKSLWVELSEINIGGDNIKFYDYFSSVDILEYKPFRVENKDNIDFIIKNICIHDHLLLPKVDLVKIQSNLLSVAPFQLKKEYYSILSFFQKKL